MSSEGKVVYIRLSSFREEIDNLTRRVSELEKRCEELKRQRELPDNK
jgi:ubiquinone biosynthesis protein UbiJ